MLTNLVPKSSAKFTCEKCNYSTSRKSQYDRHLSTQKHKCLHMLTDLVPKSSKCEIVTKDKEVFSCECGKVYKHRQSLSIHKKTCNKCENTDTNNNNANSDIRENDNYKDMFIELINENKEMRNMLIKQQEQISELIPKIGNNNTINTKNKFNINVFLNEKCKDAISIDQFIEGIEISLKNLLTTKDKGQSEGISNIIIENMNRLSLYERPLHCTDKKRETLYIKNSEWEKDDNGEQINKAIKKIETKQLKNIKKWLDANPDYNGNPEKEEEFTELLKETSRSVDDGREKIIKTLCKELYVDK